MNGGKHSKQRKITERKTDAKIDAKEIIKNTFWFACVCAVGFLVFFLIAQIGVFTEKREVSQIQKNEAIAEGIVIKTGSMKGSYVIIEFYFNGNRYEKEESSYSDDVEVGQRFKVKFNRANPLQAKIIFDEPFFGPSDKISKTSGQIIQIDGYTVRFEYSVAGKRIKKFQKYPEGKVFSNGEIHEVEYLIQNPQNAILKF